MTSEKPGAAGADEPLEQLLYASISTPRVTSALQMSDILAVARPNNARDQITGALTAANGRFIQIIEGPAAALDDLMARLGSDSRHQAIEVLGRRVIEQRAFAGWAMVSPRLMFDEAEALGALLNDEMAKLDDHIAVFLRALARQDALLTEGHGESKAASSSTWASMSAPTASEKPEA